MLGNFADQQFQISEQRLSVLLETITTLVKVSPASRKLESYQKAASSLASQLLKELYKTIKIYTS